MRYTNTKNLYEYWQNLKGARPAPARNEIEPGDIRSLLGDTFILEVDPSETVISFRLAGTRLCAAYGRELKGLGYLTHWREENNLEILRSVNQVKTENTPCLITYLGKTDQNRFLELETLLLPLLPIEDGSARILGITSAKKLPFWHGSEPITTHNLRSLKFLNEEMFSEEMLGEDSAYQKIIDPPSIVFDSENPIPAEISRQNKTARVVGHLTVLEGGKTD